MDKKIGVWICALIIFTVIALGSRFIDDTQTEFDLGTYSNTTYNGSAVILSGNNLSGAYTSRIFDAGYEAVWNNLSWDSNNNWMWYIYAADNDKDLWRSANSGVTWTEINDSYFVSDIYGITSNSNGLFVVTKDKSVHKSTDSGATWTLVNSIDILQEPRGIASDPNKNLYIVAKSKQIYKSVDNGTNWALINDSYTDKDNANEHGISADGTYIYAADNDKDLWRSSNSGVTWAEINDSYFASDIYGITSNPNGLFVVTKDKSVHKSTDSGATWTLVNSIDILQEPRGIASDPNKNLYIVAKSKQIYKSVDNGTNWALINDSYTDKDNANEHGISTQLLLSNITFNAKNCSLANCSDGSFFDANLGNISLKGRYFQYKAIFSSPSYSITSSLYNVTIDYTILNQAPIISSLTLTPYQPETNDNLDCSFTITDVDAGDYLTANVTWYKNGILNISYNISVTNGSAASNVLGSENTTKGDEWNCSVRPYDGTVYGNESSANVTIQNSIPVVASLTLSPAQPKTNEDITCSFIITDNDARDSLISNLSWYKNGLWNLSINISVANGSLSSNILGSGNTTKNDVWNCSIKPYDGAAYGSESSSATVIQNTAPSIFAVPDKSTDSMIYWSYNANATDIDFDEGVDTLTWSINNSMLDINSSTGIISDTASDSDKGAYDVKVSVTDGADVNSTIFRYTVTVNDAPSVGSISLLPLQPYTNDDLNCSFVVLDDRLQQINTNVIWYKNGILNISSNISVTNGSAASNVLGSENTTKGDEWNCSVRPYDWNRYGNESWSAVTIQNTIPVVSSLNLNPLQPKTNEDLTCSFTVIDIDSGDSLTANVTWYKNGALYSSISQSVFNGTRSSSILDSSNTAKNNVWNCSVRPYDGTVYGNENSSVLVIQNTAPSIFAVPDKSTDSMIYWSYDANATDIDVDGGVDTLTWSINNSMLDINSSTGIISDTASDSDKGAYDVKVSVTDGADVNSTIFRYTVTVNDAPSVGSISLLPLQPYTNDDLNCSFVVLDDRLQQINLNVTWYKNRVLNISYTISANNGSSNSSILSEGNTTKNDIWNCSARPYDGNRYGNESSLKVTIQNTPPTAANISIIPALPKTNNDLNVIFNDTPQDLDNDIITYSYRWYKDNVFQPSLTTSLVSSALTLKNQVWKAIVTPNDGQEDGTASQTNVTIQNSIPSITSASISPLIAYKTTTLEVSTSGWSDNDNDPEQYTYQWYNQNGKINGATSSTLSGMYFNKSDKIYSNATPYDNDDFGTSKITNNVTIQNSLPILAISLVTELGMNGTDENLIGSFAYDDADSDALSINNTKWYKYEIEQTQLVNLTIISHSNTSTDDIWIFSARANDGAGWGNWFNSSHLRIIDISQINPVLLIPPNNSFSNASSIILIYATPIYTNMNCTIFSDTNANPITPIKENTNIQGRTTIIYNWKNLQDNAYYWKAGCTNDSKLFNSSVRIFTIDTTYPTTAPNLTQALDLDKDGNIGLSWTIDSDALSYNVYRSNTRIVDATNLTKIGSITSANWKDNTTLHNNAYWYAITTVDAAGNENKSIVSESLNATGNDTIKPKTTSNANASSLNGITTISWTKVIEDINGNSDEIGLQYKLWFKKNTDANLSKSLVNETADYIKTISQESCSGEVCSITHLLSSSGGYYYFITTIDDGDSENMTLDASNYAYVTATSAPPGGSGGGGGGGGGGGTTEDSIPSEIGSTECIEQWSCSEWYSCVNDVQARTCVDINSCGTEKNKPDEKRQCGSCQERWQCGDWTACVNNKQTRVCIDKNDCGTEKNKEETERDCMLDTCNDGIKNYGEVGVDCGGPCKACKARDFITGTAIALRSDDRPNTIFLIPMIVLIVVFLVIKTMSKSKMKFVKVISSLHLPLIIGILVLFFFTYFGNTITGFFSAGNATLNQISLDINESEVSRGITSSAIDTQYNKSKANVVLIAFFIIVSVVVTMLIIRKRFPKPGKKGKKKKNKPKKMKNFTSNKGNISI